MNIFNKSNLLGKNIFIKKAFTLAEVLITLTIIGVVAAITIPVINNQYHKAIAETRLKQTHSILSQMFRKAEGVHGFMLTWPLNEYAGKNVMGKDVFMFQIPLDTGLVGTPGKHEPSEVNRQGNITKYQNLPLSTIKNYCKAGDSGSRYCSSLLYDNAWSFPKDYPW